MFWRLNIQGFMPNLALAVAMPAAIEFAFSEVGSPH